MPDTTPQHDPARDDPNDESRRDWENVQTNPHDYTERLKVRGGWLYRTVLTDSGVALVFVPEA